MPVRCAKRKGDPNQERACAAQTRRPQPPSRSRREPQERAAPSHCHHVHFAARRGSARASWLLTTSDRRKPNHAVGFARAERSACSPRPTLPAGDPETRAPHQALQEPSRRTTPCAPPGRGAASTGHPQARRTEESAPATRDPGQEWTLSRPVRSARARTWTARAIRERTAAEHLPRSEDRELTR